jgi:hypothetical protein
LERGSLPCPRRRRFFDGIVSSSVCSGSINPGRTRESRDFPPRRSH